MKDLIAKIDDRIQAYNEIYKAALAMPEDVQDRMEHCAGAAGNIDGMVFAKELIIAEQERIVKEIQKYGESGNLDIETDFIIKIVKGEKE